MSCCLSGEALRQISDFGHGLHRDLDLINAIFIN